MTVCKNRPYTIIDDEEFIELIEMCHGLANIPCMNTLATDIKLAHGMMKHKIFSLFQVCVFTSTVLALQLIPSHFRSTLGKSILHLMCGYQGMQVHTWAWWPSVAPMKVKQLSS